MDKNLNKILIIEDEKPLARALELKLIHEGFEVKVLSNGEGILELLNKEKFSLIVCDLVMPKVDGFEILKIIKDNNIEIDVLILTNLSQTEDEKRVRSLGAREFFIKSDTSLSTIVTYIKENIFNN
jgi:DNA-binding response OmpR family regulator